MSRASVSAIVVAIVGAAVVLGACSASASGGGAHASSKSSTSACPLLAALTATGQTVANANVSDPAKFEATLQTAVTQYVEIAQRLRSAVPSDLRPDVERLEAAAQQHQFTDAPAARADIDAYARSKCSSKS